MQDNKGKNAEPTSARSEGVAKPSIRLRPANSQDRSGEQLLTVAEAAERLKLSDKTVRKMIDYRLLSAVRVGVGNKRAPFRIANSEVDRYIAERTQPRL